MATLITDPSSIAGLSGAAATMLAAIGVSSDDLALLVLLLATVTIVLVVVAAIFVVCDRRRRHQIAAAEAAFARTFRCDRVRLQEVPAQLEELDRRTAELMRDHEQLRRMRDARRTETGRVRAPLVELISHLHSEAIEEREKISNDDEFSRIDKVLGVHLGLTELGKRLSQLEQAIDLPKALLTDLESSDAWNAALTTPIIFDAYFDEIEKLKPLARRLRAIEQVLNAAFLSLDVEILVKRPFSIVDRADTAIRATEAPRDLLSLPIVQEQAARKAHMIPNRSPIVLDCFAPGWNSGRIGQRRPGFTIYDPSH